MAFLVVISAIYFNLKTTLHSWLGVTMVRARPRRPAPFIPRDM